MTFLYPIAFLFSAIIPIIILMYLLKLKRKKTDVPSSMLWRRSIKDLVANAPFQKLRNNLLMYLQILALILLIFALAKPYLNLASIKGKSYILLIDKSASMQSDEKSGTRFELAVKEALKLINNLKKNEKMMLIAFDDNAEILKTATGDKLALRSALAGVKPSDSLTDVKEALLIAGSVQKATPDTEIIIISDGCFTDPQIPIKISNLQFVKVGETRDNIALTDLNIRESFEDENTLEVFISALNFDDEIKSVILSLYINGNIFASKKISAASGKSASEIFQIPAGQNGWLEISADSKDSLELDNKVFAALKPQHKKRLLLVTNGNRFLENALDLSGPYILKKIMPKEYHANEEFDLTIFDGFSPKEIQGGNYTYINSLPAIPEIKRLDIKSEYPKIIDFDQKHPIFRFVGFDKINIKEAINYSAPEDFLKTLAETSSSPIVSLYENGENRILILGFDIFKSDFPLQASFPIFITNMVSWMSKKMSETKGSADASTKAISEYNIFQTGQNISLSIFTGNKFTITEPSGKKYSVQKSADKSLGITQTKKIGVYKVISDGLFEGNKESYFGVNLLSSSESNITPREIINIKDAEIKAVAGVKKENREIWKIFVLLALFVFIIEWMIYSRRTWV